MSYSISRLPETVRQSIFIHRGKANQWVAASLGLIIMAYPCSKLRAENLLPTPEEEIFVEDKRTKQSNLLDEYINHYDYIGEDSRYFLNSVASHLIFAMNHENEQAEKKEHSEASEGAGAQLPQSLMTIPLPPMTHAEIIATIRELNTGIDQETLNIMLNFIPVTPPNESLTIESMLRKLIQTHHILDDDSQKMMEVVLPSIQGTQSPVDLTKPEQRQSLAMLMLAYYTAINSNGVSPETAYDFFNSFLLHASGLSGIERLHAQKGDLLGTDKPIEDYEILKANVKKSASVFVSLRLLDEMRIRFLEQMDVRLKASDSETSFDDSVLKKASSLLNNGLNKNGIAFYRRNIRSYERMLTLIEEHGEENPELIASNNQFMTFIHVISMMLDPFDIQSANANINNMSSYFSASDWNQTFIDSEGKEQKLFEIFKKILTAAKDKPGNKSPELFQELLTAIRKYIAQRLHKIFIASNDYQVIMLTLGSGLTDLLEQSEAIFAMLPTTDNDADGQADEAKYDEAAEGSEERGLSSEEKNKYLKEQTESLEDFIYWCRYYYDFAIRSPYNSDSSESCGSESDRGNLDGVQY